MLERNGVGIAAPQVYISTLLWHLVQIHVIPMHLKWGDGKSWNFRIFEWNAFGCCLSVPDERGQVERAEMVNT